MKSLDSQDDLRPAGVGVEEWRLRLELAACYRLFDYFGWTEMIFNHLTVRVPGGDADNPHYLINPFGLHYAFVTARNLIKIDKLGTVLDDSEYPINPAGFTIHSAIHGARDDAHCVIHTHTTAGMAVACKPGGLRHDNFYSALLVGQIAYHDFEGITTDMAECGRLVTSIGTKSVLILRNHGLLVAAADIPSAFDRYWTLQRACEIQVAADQLPGPNIPIGDDVLAAINEQRKPMAVNGKLGQLLFDGMRVRAGIDYAEIA